MSWKKWHHPKLILHFQKSFLIVIKLLQEIDGPRLYLQRLYLSVDPWLWFHISGTAWTSTGPAVAEDECTTIACRIELTNILFKDYKSNYKKIQSSWRSLIYQELTLDFQRNHEHEEYSRHCCAQTGLEHRFPGHRSSHILENIIWTIRTCWSDSANSFYLRIESLPIGCITSFRIFEDSFHHESGIKFNKGLVESSWKWFWIQPFYTLKREQFNSHPTTQVFTQPYKHA